MSNTAPISMNHPRGLRSLSSAMPRAMAPAIAGLLGRGAEQLLRSRLAQLQHGELTRVAGEHRQTFGQRPGRCALSATLRVRVPHRNGSVASRLPAFLTDRKNRAAVVKASARLEQL